METFSAAFKAKFRDDDVAKIEEALKRLHREKVASIDVRTLSPVAKMPAKIHNLLQIGLRRMIELAEAAIRELNRENPTSTFVLVRAAFETGSLLMDAVGQVRKALHNGSSEALDECDKYLMDVLMGFKSKGWAVSEEFVARNVLTIIQRLTKEIDVDLMFFFEGLSEHAHPNYLGMMAMYQEVAVRGNPVITFVDGPNAARDSSLGHTAIGALAIALDMMEIALRTEKEDRARFASVCEKKIREDGTWPADLEYPVKR